MLDRLTQFAEQAIGKLKVRSALNPSLVLCALCLPFGFWLVLTGSSEAAYMVGAALVFAPVLIFAFGFVYLVIKNPDKLRSEDYEIRKLALNLIEEKGGRVPLSEVSVEVIANPNYPQIGDLTGEDQR